MSSGQKPMQGVDTFPEHFDPYDLWSTGFGQRSRELFYQGSLVGRGRAVAISVADWWFPQLSRRLAGRRPRRYPITVAQQLLTRELNGSLDRNTAGVGLKLLMDLAAWRPETRDCWAWGLGFPWASKNGTYPADTPFVTHTPTVMQALLVVARHDEDAMTLFHGTRAFLDRLPIRSEGERDLAVAYAPLDEPRIVVNAQSYAALGYALHAKFGQEHGRDSARLAVERLIRWTLSRQTPEGGWWYYDDMEHGNFIDCLHSCLVLANLDEVTKLLPGTCPELEPALERAWSWLQESFLSRFGLCRRFLSAAQRDPFRLELYDQAEMLGLLVRRGELERAKDFSTRVEAEFSPIDQWFSRRDVLGRAWGRDFLRWGIVPYQLQRAALRSALEAV